MKVVIVGGVAGGATAAARLRRLDEQAEIIIFERSGYVSYANCGLPYYIGGEITDREELTLQTPESFRRRFNIDVRVRHEVLSLDTAGKNVTVRELETGRVFTESYDKLLLSPGAAPVVPDIPGADGPRVFTLRTVEDTFRIYDFIEREKPRRAVISGGGFIGLEMAENLMSRGLQVTMLQRPRQVMSPLDPDMASLLHARLRKAGVDLRLGCSASALEETDRGVRVLSEGHEPLEADMVLLAVGVRPDGRLAREAGLAVNSRGAIVVSDRMETSAPDVYAVGDAVEITHFVTGKRASIALAGPANKQGRIAADNMAGILSRYTGAQGSSVLKLLDMTVAVTGLNEKSIQAEGIPHDSVVLTSSSHAAYYPGARSMVVKVLFEVPSGRILGAQIVGYGGVDKRIDVLATAIRARMTAFDLTELDLSYAPPYSSAKDPVNMAGYAMENILTGKVRQFHWNDVASLPRDGSVVLLDTRTQGEWDRGHIDFATHIPVDELRQRLGELPKDKPLYVYCQSGLRSYIACRMLTGYGYECYNLSGGYGFYSSVTKDLCPPPQGTGPCGLSKEH